MDDYLAEEVGFDPCHFTSILLIIKHQRDILLYLKSFKFVKVVTVVAFILATASAG